MSRVNLSLPTAVLNRLHEAGAISVLASRVRLSSTAAMYGGPYCLAHLEREETRALDRKMTERVRDAAEERVTEQRSEFRDDVERRREYRVSILSPAALETLVARAYELGRAAR
jgi:hypothetical protein